MKANIRKRKRSEESAKEIRTHLTNRSFKTVRSVTNTYQAFILQDALTVFGKHVIDKFLRLFVRLSIRQIQKWPDDLILVRILSS